MFTISEAQGSKTNKSVHCVTDWSKNFGSDMIYADGNGSIIAKDTGIYEININMSLDKSFSIDGNTEVVIRRYNNNTGSDVVISTSYFNEINNMHSVNISVLVPMLSYEYLRIYYYGQVSACEMSIYRIS